MRYRLVSGFKLLAITLGLAAYGLLSGCTSTVNQATITSAQKSADFFAQGYNTAIQLENITPMTPAVYAKVQADMSLALTSIQDYTQAVNSLVAGQSVSSAIYDFAVAGASAYISDEGLIKFPGTTPPAGAVIQPPLPTIAIPFPAALTPATSTSYNGPINPRTEYTNDFDDGPHPVDYLVALSGAARSPTVSGFGQLVRRDQRTAGIGGPAGPGSEGGGNSCPG
jgi:hypothetical protein